MNQKDLIKKGVEMFQQSCFESSRRRNGHGNWWWTGNTCEGGGAYLTHNMDQNTMTPVAVAFEVGHVRASCAVKRIRKKAEHDANLEAIRIYEQDAKTNKPQTQ